MYYPNLPISKEDLYSYTLLSNLPQATKELILDLLIDSPDPVTSVVKFSTPRELLMEHRCPKCHKAITNWREVEFAMGTGTCLGCDHVLGDVYSEYRHDR